MANEVASNENTIDFELEPLTKEVEGGDYDAYGNLIGVNPNYVSPELSLTPVPVANVMAAPYVAKSKVQPALEKRIISFDTETTGTDPWDYRLLGCSFWDIGKPVATMESFFGFDEEKVTQDIAEYLNREKPDMMINFNNGFDQRALLTRFMLYQIPVPGWNAIEYVDIMELMKKGTTQSIGSSQASGSEETWIKYFFNESKPYNIDQLFAGIRKGDMQPTIIRNRTCVEGVGHIYLLFRQVTDTDVIKTGSVKPSAMQIDEAVEKGVCLVACPACTAVNDVPCNSSNNKCWRCLNAIPNPTNETRIKEVIRPFDFSKVGLSST